MTEGRLNEPLHAFFLTHFHMETLKNVVFFKKKKFLMTNLQLFNL